jgi:hypothetical protein
MHGFSEEDLWHIVSLYDGSIRYVDEQFGRLLSVERVDLDPETIERLRALGYLR